MRLENRQADGRFRDSRFWGPATDRGGAVIQNGFKMKWHNIGNGKNQLRLTVVVKGEDYFLCHAYVKNSPSKDHREMAKLKPRIRYIYDNTYQHRGCLS